eukprot:TRINITY_DN38817_c0_g1_i1.p1 TRINITY_DN38817_c0_g1~~TRINITY_DN38817_c0_g1_i1.p1  ORF type:complete len:600 (-),score=115.11 TRINITY_DN38817_c0_g1_i1:740-2449(-)
MAAPDYAGVTVSENSNLENQTAVKQDLPQDGVANNNISSEAPANSQGGQAGKGVKRELEENGTADGHGTEREAKRWPGWPGESVFRLLVPVHKVGTIIGRKGEFVKKMCDETRSRIKVVDGAPNSDERVVLISAKEAPDKTSPPAVEGLLRVHRQVVEGPDVDGKVPAPEDLVGTITARLLVPATQAGSLIGRQGSTIKAIQEESTASVRILPNSDVPAFALEDDRVVEVSGAVKSVYKGLELILAHLRRFLVDRSVVPLFERSGAGGARLAGDRDRNVADFGAPPHWAEDSMAHSLPPSQRGYGGPPPAMDGYYGRPPSMGPGEGRGGYPPSYNGSPRGPPRGGGMMEMGGGPGRSRGAPLSPYAQEPSISRAAPAAAPPISAPMVSIKEVTACMQIPLSYADAVIGVNGGNIVYLRRASGATITVQENLGPSGPEMSVEIRGSTLQVQMAEQLLQSFIAGQSGYQAGAAASAAPSAPSSNQAYAATSTGLGATSDPYATYGGGGGGGASSQYGQTGLGGGATGGSHLTAANGYDASDLYGYNRQAAGASGLYNTQSDPSTYASSYTY